MTLPSAKAPSEVEVVARWRQAVSRGASLSTERGDPVRIVYPGRINDDRGADFRDAVVVAGNRLLRGDIEIHVRSSDWRSHGHHQDAVYDAVVLHVVQTHDSRQPTLRHDGGTVPVLALERWEPTLPGPESVLSGIGGAPMGCHGAGAAVGEGGRGETLDMAGERRFEEKAAAFRTDIECLGAGQALFRGIMGALGYSRNKSACMELADRLPLSVLESAAREEACPEERAIRLQAMMLGTAGLLPSQRPGVAPAGGGYVDRLEEAWRARRTADTMPAGRWRLFRVRPSNTPVRRLVAMSRLLIEHGEAGLLEGMMGLLQDGAGSRRGELEDGLAVGAAGYWALHVDLGRPEGGGGPTLLGRQRAGDIIVNVLLPFGLALGRMEGREALGRRARERYRRYPRLAENTLERHMKRQLGIGGRIVDSARRQQGLVYVYRTFCVRGWCWQCPLRHRAEAPRWGDVMP